MTRAHFRATYPPKQPNQQMKSKSTLKHRHTHIHKTPKLYPLICPSLQNAKRMQEKCNKFNLCTERGAGDDMLRGSDFYGGLGWTFKPCLVWADVELVHITLHQRDAEHKLPLRGQIPLCHTDTGTPNFCVSAVVIIHVISIPTATHFSCCSFGSMFDVYK